MRLELRGVSKTYDGHKVLDRVELDADFPHVLAFIGPSGGGKSTLLRLIGGLETQTVGTIRVNGQPLPVDEAGLRAYRRSLGFVFQAYNLFPHLSAFENVLLPLEKVHGLATADAIASAREVFSRFHLDPHFHKRPAQLSGGQRQRVAIARAVAHRPRFLLLDEPTSALDPEMAAEVLDLIVELRDSGTAIVLVTHAMRFAQSAADQIAFLARGTVLEHASAHTFFENPQHHLSKVFLRRILRY